MIVEDVAKANVMRLHVGMRSGFRRARRVAGTAQPAAPSKDDRQRDSGKGVEGPEGIPSRRAELVERERERGREVEAVRGKECDAGLEPGIWPGGQHVPTIDTLRVLQVYYTVW